MHLLLIHSNHPLISKTCSTLIHRLVQNLYAPVSVVRSADGMLIVRTMQGEGDEKEEIFLRLKEGGENIVDVVEEHKKGVHDILNLSDFSSMSLLNTYLPCFLCFYVLCVCVYVMRVRVCVCVCGCVDIILLIFSRLRVRYKKDQCYTAVGPILISLNPYKWIDGAYSEETMVKFIRRGSQIQGCQFLRKLLIRVR